MPSHNERVRRNYRCPECDGDGHVTDSEGQYWCATCDGSGVVLHTLPPVPAFRKMTASELANATEGLRTVQKQLCAFREINKEYGR